MDKITARVSGEGLPRRTLDRFYIQRWWAPENVRVRSGDENKKTS